jgi:osmotically inducible protein OsmC
LQTLYQAHATARGGRNGHVATDDGVVNFDLAIPKEMGGPGGAKTNPEQLFAAGYAACFDNALQFVAKQQKIKLPETSVKASVAIGPNTDGGFVLAVQLDVSIPGLGREQSEALLEKTHKTCPYSNAVRGNIEVTTRLV